MDYNQEQFFRMQMDVPKMPFYMSYPMQNLYLTEMEYEKDMERMKELYPKEVKTILSYVEDECDKMEYEGSLMFDEYPDRLMLEQVAERIYRNVAGEEKNVEAEQYWGGMNPPPGPGMPPPPPPGPGMPPPPPPGGRDDMRSLIADFRLPVKPHDVSVFSKLLCIDFSQLTDRYFLTVCHVKDLLRSLICKDQF